MEVRFYCGRKKVYSVQATSISGAIELMDSTGIEWSRYRIF